MRLIVPFTISLVVMSVSGAFAANLSPDELIENFYSARRMMHKTALEILGYSELSGEGKKAAEEGIYDYTVIETATVDNVVSYAEVEVKKRSIDSGIRVQKEYWKMIKTEGRWVIKNIYTPEDWQLKQAVRPGSSLSEKVEALAAFEFEYEVEDVPPGTPLQKAYAYITRGDYVKALYWADVAVKQRHDAESYFIRGLLNLVNRRAEQGKSDILRAIEINPDYYYVLQDMINGSSGGSSSSTSDRSDSSTRTVKGNVKGLFR